MTRALAPTSEHARSHAAARALRRLRVAFGLALVVSACSSKPRPHTPQGPFDLQGTTVNPLAATTAATVLVFVTTECPISNRYAPEVQRVEREFSPRGVKFFLVYSSRLDTVAEIRAHLSAHGYAIPALRDPDGVLVARAKARRTPEAAVFGPSHALAYSGRIDDRFVDFGQERQVPQHHDLESALAAVLRGEPVVPNRRDAVGCSIAQP